MCTGPIVVAGLLLSAGAGFAASPMAPSDIQATFFNGQPFTHKIQNDFHARR